MIDVGPLVGRGGDADAVAATLDAACREVGFFTIVGHGVDPALLARLDTAARDFFALGETEKAEIAMARAGRAWRGWFPEGGELTAGVPDRKEGLYFGAEHGPDHPLVRAGAPLHGPNLFPRRPAALRAAVLAWLDEMTRVGQAVLAGLGQGLGLGPTWFAEHLTADPVRLFRIFRYPPVPAGDPGWGVAEHTDYGLLTLLAQDDRGGLEVWTGGDWIEVEPVEGGFVCNLGDMLERLTGGRYRSTPHRVRNTSARDRLSFPFFLDPSWEAEVAPLPLRDEPAPTSPHRARWDRLDLEALTGTYGDYLTAKVAKVFPDLVTPPEPAPAE